MRSTTLAILAAGTTALVLVACARTPENRAADSTTAREPAASRAAVVDRDWALVTLRDSVAPLGAGGSAATAIGLLAYGRWFLVKMRGMGE